MPKQTVKEIFYRLQKGTVIYPVLKRVRSQAWSQVSPRVCTCVLHVYLQLGWERSRIAVTVSYDVGCIVHFQGEGCFSFSSNQNIPFWYGELQCFPTVST